MNRLEHSWNLSKFSHWKDIMPLDTFTTVEEFWRGMNHLPYPSVKHKMNYSFFRSDSDMLWEHPTNKLGGKWIISVPAQVSVKRTGPVSSVCLGTEPSLYFQTEKIATIAEEESANATSGSASIVVVEKHKLVDLLWERILLLLIGNEFENENNLLYGVVVNSRHDIHRLNIWSGLGEKGTNDKDLLTQQGQFLRSRLQLPKIISLEYKKHKDSEEQSSTLKAASFLVC